MSVIYHILYVRETEFCVLASATISGGWWFSNVLPSDVACNMASVHGTPSWECDIFSGQNDTIKIQYKISTLSKVASYFDVTQNFLCLKIVLTFIQMLVETKGYAFRRLNI